MALRDTTNDGDSPVLTTPPPARKRGGGGAGGKSRSKRKSGLGAPSTPALGGRDACDDDDDAAAGGGSGGICGLLSPNCDSEEKRTARQKKRESIERRIALLTPHSKRNTRARTSDDDDDDDTNTNTIGGAAGGGGKAGTGVSGAMREAMKMLKNDQIIDLYKSCIKLASENKINTKNTWSLQLIDHLSDIVHDEKEGPNFQKASCTLDAGVKIYSSRVDSTHSETFRVLGGLSKSQNGAVHDDDRDDDNGDDNGNGAVPGTVEKRRRGKKSGGEMDRDGQTVECFTANLEEEDSLQAKELATAYNTDPLFAKMSAAFDEGGGAGMLLHNLPCLRGCELAFDANEKPLDKLTASTHDAMVDEAYTRDMRAHVQADVACLHEQIVSLREALTRPSLRITPSYDGLLAMGRGTSAGAEGGATTAQETGLSLLVSSNGGVLDADNYGDNDDDDDDIDAGFRDDALMNAWGSDDVDDDDDDDDIGNTSGGPSRAMFTFASLSVSSSDKDGVNATEWLESLSGAGSGGGGLAGKGWAGVSHWRYRAPAGTTTAVMDRDGTSADDSRKKSRTRSAPDHIDFHSPESIPDSAFEVAKDLSKICVSEKTLNSFADTLLPEDFHYEAKSLGRLFLKPRVPLRKLMKRVTESAGGMQTDSLNAMIPIDDDDDMTAGALDDGGDFWAGGIDNDDDDGNHNSNNDMSDDDNAFGMPSSDNVSLGQNGLLQAAHHVEKINIDFDKRPKQVDVRALKSSLWSNVQVRSENKQEGFVDRFSDIISTLPKNNPAGRAADISVHLCFICMLHLANENDLTIKGDSSLSELRISGM